MISLKVEYLPMIKETEIMKILKFLILHNYYDIVIIVPS
jgi:hypothetical protein